MIAVWSVCLGGADTALITGRKPLLAGLPDEKYKREKLIVSIFAVIFVVIVVILGNFLVTYIFSNLRFYQNCSSL